MSNALIVVDAQNDFITGPLGTEEARRAIEVVEQLVGEAKDRGDMIFFTQDTHGENYLNTREGKWLPVKHCLLRSHGWELDERIALPKGPKVRHLTKSSFAYPNWGVHNLDKYDKVVVCGFCTDICVISNVLAIQAHHPNIDIEVIANACAGTTPEKHAAALAVMSSCQIKWYNYIEPRLAFVS